MGQIVQVSKLANQFAINHLIDKKYKFLKPHCVLLCSKLPYLFKKSIQNSLQFLIKDFLFSIGGHSVQHVE